MFNVYRYDHEQRNASPPENRRQTSVPPARRRSRSHSPRRAPAGREKLTINIKVLESNFCEKRFVKLESFYFLLKFQILLFRLPPWKSSWWRSPAETSSNRDKFGGSSATFHAWTTSSRPFTPRCSSAAWSSDTSWSPSSTLPLLLY